MNRYASYQYSNNNFSYSSPFSDSSSKPKQTTSAYLDSISNKYPATSSRSYKSSELPWTSRLASINRYPLSRSSRPASSTSSSTDTSTSSSLLNPSTGYSNGTSYRPSERARDSVISTTLSGRSLFDYSSPKTAINTPSSRIYDGQLRRTATTRFVRDRPELNYASGQSKKLDNNTPSVTSSSISSTYTSSTGDNKTGKISSGQSCIAKPFRSSSLKLRASYTNILDQLTTTTLAKLKLGSSSNQTQKSTTFSRPTQLEEQVVGWARNRDSRTSTRLDQRLMQPALEVVRDEPEGEAAATCLNVKHFYPTLKLATDSSLGATSPESSSSGLSSGGPVDEANSPNSTSSLKQARFSPPLSSDKDPSKSKLLSDELKNMEDSGHSNGDSTNEDLSSEEDESESTAEDDDDEDVVDDDDDDEDDVDEDEDEEQQTIISPVDRKISYLDEELGHSVSRDQLFETGPILADSKELDNTGDCGISSDISKAALSCSNTDKSTDIDKNTSKLTEDVISLLSNPPINESELVLKPRANRREPIIMEIKPSYNSGVDELSSSPKSSSLAQSKSRISEAKNESNKSKAADNIGEADDSQDDDWDEVSLKSMRFQEHSYLIVRAFW